MTSEAGRATGEEGWTAASHCIPLFALALSLFACATPVAPTGGPVDSTPPRLIASSPEADAVGVSGRTVRLSFSERIDAASAARAVTVTPQPAPGEAMPRVEAAGDELVVTLPELRDSTTYVVTVGTALADRRGVRLPAPITLAFATGDRLDRGEINGTVRLPTDGAGVAGLTVLAYRVLGDSLPDPRSARPDARTETGADGAFSLGYLADQPHFVAALRDLNRNGRADDGEPFAAPPSPRLRPALPSAPRLDAMPDSLAAPRGAAAVVRAASLDLWLARRDTVPPTVRSIRALSDRRVEIRFSEGIALYGSPLEKYTVWGARHADGRPGGSVQATYHVDPARPTVLTAWLDGAAVGDSLGFGLTAVLDSTGNQFFHGAELPFVAPSAQPDTARTRILGLDRATPPDSAVQVLRRGFYGLDIPVLRLSGPSAFPVTVVGERAPSVRDARGLDTLTVSGYSLPLQYSLPDPLRDLPYRTVRGPLPDTTLLVRTVRPAEDAVGSIIVRPGRPLADSLLWWIEATPASGGAAVGALYSRATRSRPGQFEITELLPGPYRVRFGSYAGQTRPRLPNLNAPKWSGGSLSPYLPPDPLVILAEPVEVRARWETEIDAALLAPLFDDAAPTPDAAPPDPDR